MGLEQVFSCPSTVERLRSGALGNLVDGFCGWLLVGGFRLRTIRTHLANISHLGEHLGRRGVSAYPTISSQVVDDFLESYPSWGRHRGSGKGHPRRVQHSVRRFVEYLRDSGLFDSVPQCEMYQPLLDDYLEWMERYQHASIGTLQLRTQYLTQFLGWLGTEASRQGLARLSGERVEAFFLSYAQKVGGAARRSMQAALRTFFRFCLHQGYLCEPLDRAVPTLRTYKLSGVPRGLTDAEAHQALQGIDRKTAVGRRDYAIVQLLYTYGVRGCQVRALRLEHIDWAQNRILFPSAKRGKDSLLPLTPEVGESLIEYLRYSRPSRSYPEVFLTSRAPYHPLGLSGSLSAIVDRRLRAAGVEASSKGAHTFRHCFATRMLQQGHSLKAVADVLGHRCLSSTFLYTKVDFNHLKQEQTVGDAANGTHRGQVYVLDTDLELAALHRLPRWTCK